MWKSIKWFNVKYFIDTIWNIKSIKYNTPRVLSTRINSRWYLYVNLCKLWKYKSYRIHRLVAESFIQNPEIKKTVNHKDWNKLNNNVENLEWCTFKENQRHSVDVLFNNRWEKNWNSKLKKEDVEYIKTLKWKISCPKIWKMFWVSKTCIRKILNNKNWK